MRDPVFEILKSRSRLPGVMQAPIGRKACEEGGCGVVGFAASVPLRGRHIFQPSMQMHNRGNGKGGGIAAAGLDPAWLGVTQQILDDAYLLQIAFMDRGVEQALEAAYIAPALDVLQARWLAVPQDYRDLGLAARPPDVKQYFVRVKPAVLQRFAGQLPGLSPREVEDEWIWQNSFKINQQFYASLGDKKAFVLSHARNLMILKIVGYAEDVVKYYGLTDMPAHIWIAHQRYPTKGRVWHPGGAHPFIGLNEALVHNGDFANYYSVCEYLKQRHIAPQFLTDTEVSVMLFDLWSRVYRYPLEYVIEALAPTTELDFDRLPEAKQKIYGAIQATHIHASPDGPWFFIIARTQPDAGEYQLMGITDTAMLRPQVFAWQEGPVQIGLCASEKQAIDAALESIAGDDPRFRPIADKYWNARGGSHNDGGAFMFRLQRGNVGLRLTCVNKFGELMRVPAGRQACDFTEPIGGDGVAEDDRLIRSCLDQNQPDDLFRQLMPRLRDADFRTIRRLVDQIVHTGSTHNLWPRSAIADSRLSGVADPGHSNSRPAAGIDFDSALQVLTLLCDQRYDLGMKKRSSVRQILLAGIYALLDATPLLEDLANTGAVCRRLTWETRAGLRPPREGEQALVISAAGFPSEGPECDAMSLVQAAEFGWRRFIVYQLRGQRFHGCGLGAGSDGIRIDLYGSAGDYAGSGLDGGQLYIHGDAQDQLGQIMKAGKLVIYGNVGQTFMYGAKGGTVYVMNHAAGRPLINAVGCPRVVINGTCLDFLAESFMAGDPLQGGGFVIVNGIEFDEKGRWRPLALPYPGSNLFSLASGGALYIRDPRNTLVEQQLNGGWIARLTPADWGLIRPYLQENEQLFNVRVADLLTVAGAALAPEQVYCKIVPMQVSLLGQEMDEEED